MVSPKSREKPNRFKWALFGAVLSLGSPVGLFLLKTFMPDSIPFTTTAYIYNALGTLVAFSLFGFLAGNFIDKFDFIASHDILTQLANRRYMQARLTEHFDLCIRHKMEFLVLMLDLDLFKNVNDTFGHHIGDIVLRRVSADFTKTCRKSDIVSRWGGEEFLLLCPQTDFEQGKGLAERIRANASNLNLSDLGLDRSQTLSIGLVSITPNETSNLNQVLQKLDEALYQAKNKGRNCVVSLKL